MADLKETTKRIGKEGATAGVLLYSIIAIGVVGLIILLILLAFT
jgi:hypothetical protein